MIFYQHIKKTKNLTLNFILLLGLLGLCTASSSSAQILGGGQNTREYRAVWLTTLSGLDWPKEKVRVPADTLRQQQALLNTLDRLKAAGINTVFFQTRIRSTVAYSSSIEPWDGAFSGVPGRSPHYDPLAFAIRACHERGLELHAWVVAFPICNVSLAKTLGREALPAKRPDLCKKCGDAWFMNPGVPETADYLAGICKEIVERYRVDGIHLDYIRYPEESIAWNDQATYRKYGNGKRLSDWRRENVTRVVTHIHDAIKSVRPWVRLSCSPVGKRADLPRQSSYGWNARDAVFQDAASWLQKGLMDALFPMMYFDGKHFYPFAQDWQEQSGGRPVAPGLGIYFLSEKEKNWPLETVTRQLHFVRQLNMGGTAFFRSKFLTDNTKGLYDFLRRDFYRQMALTPAMKADDEKALVVPHVTASRKGNNLQFSWETVKTDTPVTYNVYQLSTVAENGLMAFSSPLLLASELTSTTWTYSPALPSFTHGVFVVKAMDAYGQECGEIMNKNIVAVDTTACRPLSDFRNLFH